MIFIRLKLIHDTWRKLSVRIMPVVWFTEGCRRYTITNLPSLLMGTTKLLEPIKLTVNAMSLITPSTHRFKKNINHHQSGDKKNRKNNIITIKNNTCIIIIPYQNFSEQLKFQDRVSQQDSHKSILCFIKKTLIFFLV